MPKLSKTVPEPAPGLCHCGRPIKVIDCYCRVSEDYDGDGGLRSVDDQALDSEEFVEGLGCCYRVGEVFKDPDLSAWRKNVVRPDFNACMARLAGGESYGLWVYDITRFSRKPEEGQHLIAAADRGHKLFSNNQERDLTRADDRKWFRDRLNDAEHESMRLSERVTRGKRLKATRRGVPNTSTRPFGSPGPRFKPLTWDTDNPGEPWAPIAEGVDRVEREARAVNHVARMILAGESNSDCFRWLNDQGLLTVRGNTWGHNTFRQMMTRPSLAGFVTYKGKILEDKELPKPWVLERKTWHEVQAVLGSRKTGPTPRRHLLTNLMFCSECGRPLSGAVRKVAAGTPSGRVYKCNGDWIKGRRACGKTAIAADFADSVVGRAVVKRLSDARHHQQLVLLGAEGAARRAVLEAAIEAAEKTDVALAVKLGRGAIRQAAYDAFVESNEERIADLRAELDEIPKVGKPTVAAEEAARMWHAAENNLEVRRRMVREAFPRLTLKPAAKRGGGFGGKLDAGRIAFEGVEGSPDRVNMHN